MNIEEYDSTVDSFVIGPRARLKANTRRIIGRYPADIPSEIAEMIAASRLRSRPGRIFFAGE